MTVRFSGVLRFVSERGIRIMKKTLAAVLVIAAVICIVYFAGGGKNDKDASVGTPNINIAAETISAAGTISKNATSFLVGTFAGSDGSEIFFDGIGTYRNGSDSGEYTLTDNGGNTGTLSLTSSGKVSLYSFQLISGEGEFSLVSADRDAVDYSPIAPSIAG